MIDQGQDIDTLLDEYNANDEGLVHDPITLATLLDTTYEEITRICNNQETLSEEGVANLALLQSTETHEADNQADLKPALYADLKTQAIDAEKMKGLTKADIN